MNYYISTKVLLFYLLLCSTQNAYSMFHFPNEYDEESVNYSNSVNKSQEPLLYISSQIEEESRIPLLMSVKNKCKEFTNISFKAKIIVATLSLGYTAYEALLIWPWDLSFGTLSLIWKSYAWWE